MSRSSSEIRRQREKRTVSATVGYCFVIVLVVLLVMSNVLTSTYKDLLQSERAETMQSIAVASSAALGHTSINEGMNYPLPVYSYDTDKNYIISIYTKTTDSFRLLYSSLNESPSQYLSGVGNEYINCFEQQNQAFTKRVENGVVYVCAIAPIISSENTVSGILEVRMPMSDFTASVNGMSLSWIFTIFSIAISMGIMIFELNLFVTTLTRGITPNMPVLLMYGENAVRFLSFFMALGAVMPPVLLSIFMKEHLAGSDSLYVNLLTCLCIIIYSIGFYCFSSIRRVLKLKLTSRIALVTFTALGYLFCLIAGLADNPIVLALMMLPISFCYGMPMDALRDYRINASKLGYKNFTDRKVHNLQLSSYFLGVSVGTVVAGICYERFGLLIVSIISGAALMLTSLGIIYFMRNNNPVKESYLPLNKLFELLTDKYTGRFILSSFVVLGVDVAFLITFVPNYLETVGISLATTSFYYLLTAFAACFIASVIKGRYSNILTSKVRVIISSTSSLLGLALFALMPTAKVLCVTSILLGISLGIHDYYYIYVLYLLSANRIKANLRKAAEMSLLVGFIVASIVLSIALFSDDLRIILLISLLLFFICGFIYPMSSFSNDVDDKDVSRTNSTNNKKKVAKSKPVADIAYSEPEQVIAPDPVVEYPAEQPAVTEYYSDNQYDYSTNANLYQEATQYSNVQDNYGYPYTDNSYVQDNGLNQGYNNAYYPEGGNDNGYVE